MIYVRLCGRSLARVPEPFQPLVIVIVALGLACASPSTPTPVLPSATDPQVPVFEMVAVSVAGRVIDADSDKPVRNAIVTPVRFCARGILPSSGECQDVKNPPAPGVTADENGAFALVANIPKTWTELLLGVISDGYEPMRIYVLPDEVTAARLWVFSTLTVSPGESLTIRRFLGAMNCGYEGYLCRRVMVSALPDGLIDVDVHAVDGQDVGILNGSGPLNFPSQRQVTVSGGEVWIYPGAVQSTAVRGVFDQRVTVSAGRH